MKKYIALILTIGCVIFLASCQSNEKTTLQIKNELDPKTLDAGDIAEEAVAPLYLPEVDGKEASLSYEKSGLTAAIKDGETALASFTYSKVEGEAVDYPSTAGEAYVAQDDNKVTIRYRMSDAWACEVSSEQLSAQELEKVLDSFTIREVP